ncbi:hypothetical protein AVEN_161564-1 [Araneus ventricosus]|uniref:Histone-lysine N-methyltransferase SETMAR n=1 Tax=Araneus ventricosus TaxID=182803 RepID=A0A4Y2NL72_ARAVE|nr:hypothetical protein AVEN_161564-1 [Araneus ventricosus]
MPRVCKREKRRISAELAVSLQTCIARLLQISCKLKFLYGTIRQNKCVGRAKVKVAKHAHHNLNVAPSDFHLFGPLKKHLTDRHFITDTEVQETVVKWLRDLDPDFVHAGFDRLVYR